MIATPVCLKTSVGDLSQSFSMQHFDAFRSLVRVGKNQYGIDRSIAMLFWLMDIKTKND